MIGGSQYAVFSTVQHPQAFDFHSLEDSTSPQEGAEIIPYRTMKNVLELSVIEGLELPDGKIRGDAAMLARLRAATSARVVHILPPPPTRDNEAIKRKHEARFASAGLATTGVSSPELRLRFWLLQASILGEVCRDLGIELMMPPAEALHDRFLRAELHKGGAHANALYGELLLREIEARFLPTKTGQRGWSP